MELFLNDSSVGFLNMNLETERVDNSLDFESSMIFDFFDIAENFRGYKAFLGLLGIEVPKLSLAHWTPTLKDGTLWCYFVNSVGGIDGISFSNRTFDNELVANFNIFPNKELAEKAVNLSKLGRLILLWQYANDCIFEADWKDGDTKKYFIRYDYIKEEVCHDYNVTISSDTLYFETIEQVKTFIEMYETEIKKIMEVI